MRKFCLFLCLSLVLSILLIGCAEESTPKPYPPPPIPSPTITPTPSPTTPTTPSAPQYNWEITNLRYKITEKSENYWYFSWQATVKNNTSSKMEFFIYVNFVDKDGFIIDYDVESLALNPKEQKSIKGILMIKAELASDVKRIELGEVSAFIKD